MKSLKEIQLEALQAIENTPSLFPLIPVALELDDGTVEIPVAIMDYLEKQGVKVELDDNGRIDVNSYNELLTENHLGINQARIIRFIDAEKRSNIK